MRSPSLTRALTLSPSLCLAFSLSFFSPLSLVLSIFSFLSLVLTISLSRFSRSLSLTLCAHPEDLFLYLSPFLSFSLRLSLSLTLSISLALPLSLEHFLLTLSLHAPGTDAAGVTAALDS
jgi:hypothetical protein